jgi:hypothetical protein
MTRMWITQGNRYGMGKLEESYILSNMELRFTRKEIKYFERLCHKWYYNPSCHNLYSWAKENMKPKTYRRFSIYLELFYG